MGSVAMNSSLRLSDWRSERSICARAIAIDTKRLKVSMTSTSESLNSERVREPNASVPITRPCEPADDNNRR